MFIEIKLLLEAIDASPHGYQLPEEIGQKIVFFYRMGGEIQAHLIKELAQCSHLKFTELLTSPEFILDEADQELSKEILQSIDQMRLHDAENKKIDYFQQQASKLFPNIGTLDLSREEWLQALTFFTKLDHERFTIPSLLMIFSIVKKIDERTLVTILSKEPLIRSGKQRLHSSLDPRYSSYKRKRNEMGGGNPLLFASSEPDNLNSHSPLRQTGVRIIPTPNPTPSENGYPVLFLSPNKTQIIRPFVTNNRGTLFKPTTPLGHKSQQGMVDTNNRKIGLKPTRLKFERPKPVRFTATLEKIQQRQGLKRRMSQYQLTGARCIEVFKMLGCEEPITITGHDYHWSHLIAYFLGGEHNKENLAPSTAAANYNTLELVELPIAEKLANDRVSSIDIEVSPYYGEDNESFIPDLLLFCLTWQSPKDGDTHFEEIAINPRSYQRVTSSMHRSIAKLRTMDEQGEDEQLENEENSEGSPKPYMDCSL